MPDRLGSIRRQLDDFWSNLEAKQKRNLTIIIILVIVGIIVSAAIFNRKEYVVLYSGLDEKEAAEIYSKLKEIKVEPKIRGVSTILVPANNEAEIRMELTKQGYPKSGFNYDLYLGSGSFGQTDDEKQALYNFQLQERLAQSIKILDGVEDAVVTIGMPKTDSFVLKSQQIPVTASVLIKLASNYKISATQAKNIEQLVAKSVPGLEDQNITIIDTNMNVLNSKSGSTEQLDSHFDLKVQLEERVKKQVIDLLEPVFGYSKVATTVNLTLNFDKKVKESVTFQPVIDDEGIVVSREELKEKVQNGQSSGVAGENNNTTQYPEQQSNEEGAYDKTNTTVNYEVNEIKEKIEEQQGKVEDLSISVIVDNDKLDTQTLEQVKELVTKAVGTDPSRVAVYSMKFDHSFQDQIINGFENKKPKNNIWSNPIVLGIISAVIAAAVVTILVLNKSRKNKEYQMMNELAENMEAQPVKEQIPEIDMDSSEENQIKSQLEKLASQKPDVVAQLLRNWLNEN